MKQFKDYLEMARRDNPAVIDTWWKKNFQYAIRYVDESNPNDFLTLMRIEADSEDVQPFLDSTAKHQALQVLNVLGVTKFEGMIKDAFVDNFTYDLSRDQSIEVIDDLKDPEDYDDDDRWSDMDDSDARDRAGELIYAMDLNDIERYINEKRSDWNI